MSRFEIARRVCNNTKRWCQLASPALTGWWVTNDTDCFLYTILNKDSKLNIIECPIPMSFIFVPSKLPQDLWRARHRWRLCTRKLTEAVSSLTKYQASQQCWKSPKTFKMIVNTISANLLTFYMKTIFTHNWPHLTT